MKIIRDTTNNRWRATKQYKGKRKYFYSTETNKTKAKAEINKKIKTWLDNFNLKDTDIRLFEAWERFLKDYEKKNRITSAKQIKSIYSTYISKLKHMKLLDIAKLDWQNLIDEAYSSGATSKTTLKNISSVIRTFCKWSATKGLINDRDVPLYFDVSQGLKPQEKHILQPQELKLLFSKEAETNYYIYVFRFLVLTGLRRGELCALQYERDFDGDYISVRESISPSGVLTEGKTTQAQRTILLSGTALEQIERHRAITPSFYLFSNPKGLRLSPQTLWWNWKSWREKHSINLTLHELRHTHISYSRLKTAISLEELKGLYGHSSSMDTEGVYVHAIDLSPEEKKAEIEKNKAQALALDEMFKNLISE